MNILRKIKLSAQYGKGIYILSGIYSLAAAVLCFFKPMSGHSFQRKQFRDLSGGEARVIEMYLVIKSPADFCILDEPFSNIAPIHVEKMQKLIQEEKAHKGIIVSDHLYEAIIQVSDDLFLLRDGYSFPIVKNS